MNVGKNGLTAVMLAALVTASICSISAKPNLKTNSSGEFKVIMMSDLQDGKQMDARTMALSEKMLQIEKPDMVIIGGDCIAGYDGSINSVDDVKQAMSQVASVFEKNHVPWAVVLGNHDTEFRMKLPFTRRDMITAYSKYPYNMNKVGPKNVFGAGNDCLSIKDNSGKKPIFNLWLLDSNMYAPSNIVEFTKGLPKDKADNGWYQYDWIHTDQVWWYYSTSKKMEEKYGAKIPGLMYFHMPIREFIDLIGAKRDVGDRHEGIGSSSVNSGLLAAILERGDVKGVFCGHEHINNFAGNWMGITLGYDASNTYSKASYNLADDDPNNVRTRGARVFVINQNDPWHFKTYMRFIDGTQGPVLPQ